MSDTKDSPSKRFWEKFANVVSGYLNGVFILLILSTILLVLSVISLAFVEPGTSSYVIVLLDLIILVPFTALLCAVLYLFHDR